MRKVYPSKVRSSRSAAPLIAGLFCLVSLFLSTTGLNAQTNSASVDPSNQLQWKDPGTMDQIIQQELAQTNVSLAEPHLTDWASAMLEAYRSLLTFSQVELQSSHEVERALDKAFYLMQTETIPYPESRLMVMDDMKSKRVELAQKLSFQ